MQTNEPFTTTNRQLAFALASAGCLFATRDQEGPTINIYSVGFLRANKIGAGLDIEDAAKMAVAKRIPGNVVYLFERNATFFEAIKAWDKTAEELRNANQENREAKLPNIDAATVATVLCIHANNRETLDQLPFVNRAWVSTVTTSTKEEKEKTTISGQGKMWKIGSKETRKHFAI